MADVKEQEMDKQSKAIQDYVLESWKGDKGVLKTLEKYIAIPNQSPDYDPDIHTNGYQEQACDLLVEWVKRQNVKDLKMQVFKNDNNDEKDDTKRTPLIFMTLESTKPDKYKHTVLMYGHFDKQPPLTADWDDDLGPHKPVIKDGKLYGRGGADDGYSIFAAIDSIKALQLQNLDYPRIVILIEGSEESGSPDLVYYKEKLKDDIGNVDYVICLDSGCQNYEQLWLTVSLRGILMCYLKVQLLTEGIHSGDSGLTRCTFHVVRELLDRIDNYKEAKMIDGLHADIPASHKQFAKECAQALGDGVWKQVPFLNENVQPQISRENVNENNKLDYLTELLLNRTWRPQLTITGIEGIPDLKGGNVLRKYTTVKLSIRLPPSLNPDDAEKVLKETVNKKPLPYNAHVEFKVSEHRGAGFVCPEFKGWLREGLQEASKTYFNGKTALFCGEGGSIPLMGQLQKLFPTAQFIVTGILGPNSNAHGPNEFLHIGFTKRVTMCMAHILNVIALKHT